VPAIERMIASAITHPRTPITLSAALSDWGFSAGKINVGHLLIYTL